MADITEAYDYCVAQKSEGVWKWRRIGLIIAYILLPVIALLVIIKSTILAPLGAFLALGDAVLVFFTWRFVSLEYEYSIAAGKITFSHIQNAFNHRIRKQKVSFMIKDCTSIAPYGGQGYELDAEVIYNALSSSSAEDAYAAVFTDENGRRCAFLFEATREALRRCSFYNKAATVVKETRY